MRLLLELLAYAVFVASFAAFFVGKGLDSKMLADHLMLASIFLMGGAILNGMVVKR